ncbi:MAG: DUF3795 domain-containing protein [Flexilinea sp.]
MIAACGMNCGICIAYLREKKPCSGCNGTNVNKTLHCIQCVIKNCQLISESKNGFCYECSKFPCLRLQQLDKRYRTKYNMSMIDNLNMIKSDGMQKFLENEKKRWTCTNCGGVICVHKSFCISCKSTLSGQKT